MFGVALATIFKSSERASCRDCGEVLTIAANQTEPQELAGHLQSSP
jgi:hypothetical protein